MTFVLIYRVCWKRTAFIIFIWYMDVALIVFLRLDYITASPTNLTSTTDWEEIFYLGRNVSKDGIDWKRFSRDSILVFAFQHCPNISRAIFYANNNNARRWPSAIFVHFENSEFRDQFSSIFLDAQWNSCHKHKSVDSSSDSVIRRKLNLIEFIILWNKLFLQEQRPHLLIYFSSSLREVVGFVGSSG